MIPLPTVKASCEAIIVSEDLGVSFPVVSFNVRFIFQFHWFVLPWEPTALVKTGVCCWESDVPVLKKSSAAKLKAVTSSISLPCYASVSLMVLMC